MSDGQQEQQHQRPEPVDPREIHDLLDEIDRMFKDNAPSADVDAAITRLQKLQAQRYAYLRMLDPLRS